MWFLLGLITLAICIYCSYITRKSAIWKAEYLLAEGFEYKFKKNRNRVTTVFIGIDGLPEYNFIIKHENWYDGLCKKLGVVKELQTGDVDFDKRFYVLSDNIFIHKKLVNSGEVRKAIKSIFYFSGSLCAKVKKMECRNGRLWVELSTKNGISEANIEHVIAKPLLPVLKIIFEELSRLQKNDYSLSLDASINKRLMLLAVSTGLTINAAIYLTRLYFVDLPYLISSSELIWHSIMVGFLIVALLVAFTLIWMKNSSRVHLILFELIPIGLLGAIGSVFHEMRDFNIEWQQEPPEIIKIELGHHYVGFRKNLMNNNYLVYRDWNCQCEDTVKISVSTSTYSSLISYQYHQVIQYDGALGYKWIANIQPVKNPEMR